MTRYDEGCVMIDHRFKYGAPEMILLHDNPQIKYVAEVLACQQGYNPNDAKFIPAPVRPFQVWCPGCFKSKDPTQFHSDRTRPTGRQVYCIACKKIRRKAGKHLPAIAHGRLKPFSTSQT
jgi:hypothetical protein